jgi:hypothetical protein
MNNKFIYMVIIFSLMFMITGCQRDMLVIPITNNISSGSLTLGGNQTLWDMPETDTPLLTFYDVMQE